MTIVIFVTLCWMVLNATFQAISAVPGNVMRWIGGSPGSNSNMGDTLGENSRAMVAAGAHKVAGGIEATRTRKYHKEMAEDRKAGKVQDATQGQEAGGEGRSARPKE